MMSRQYTHRLNRLRRELPLYWQRGQHPQTCFVIFAQGRTGSWLLHSLLNNHPQIDCAKEILEQRVLWPRRYVDAYALGSSQPTFGFHVQINQLLHTQRQNAHHFLQTLHDKGWRMLYLWRRNIMRQSISTMIARQRQQWYTTEVNVLAGQKFHIDRQILQQWLHRREAHLALERNILASIPHLELVYEDDLLAATKHQTTMARVFDFLDVAPMTTPIQAAVARITPDQLTDYVENYDELWHAFKNTPYEQYLI